MILYFNVFNHILIGDISQKCKKNILLNSALVFSDKSGFSLTFSCLKTKSSWIFLDVYSNNFKDFQEAIIFWISQGWFSHLPQNILNWFHFQTTKNLADNHNCLTEFRSLCNKIIENELKFWNQKFKAKFFKKW